MHLAVGSRDEFAERWDSRVNFLLSGACVPFSFAFPPTDQIIRTLIASDGTVATPGQQWRQTEYAGKDHNILEDLRALPPDELRTASFALRHGELAAFDHPGGMLEGFEQQVMERWYAWLWGMGFEWDRCYSILRTSGAGTVTGYHMVRL